MLKKPAGDPVLGAGGPEASPPAVSPVERIGFALVAFAFLCVSFVLYDFVEEDAYIYFRVAENLASGHGYVFNAGGPRVETGSSPLWQLMLAALATLPGELLVKTKAISIVFSLGALFMTWRLASIWIAQPFLRLLPPLLLVATVPFMMWAQAGLETPGYQLVALWFAWTLCRSGAERQIPLASAVLALSRPEGVILLAALAPYAWLFPERRRLVAATCAAVAAVLLAATVARLIYFQDLVVSPFYVKFDAGKATRGRFLWDFAVGYQVPLLLGIGIAGVSLRRAWTRRLVVALGVALAIGVWLLIAGEKKPYFRHYALVLPFVYVVFVAGLDALLRAPRVPAALRAPAALAAGLVALALVALDPEVPRTAGQSGPNPIRERLAYVLRDPALHLRDILRKIDDPSYLSRYDEEMRTPGRNIHYNYQALVGLLLRSNYPADATVFYDQMGQTPYFAGPGMTFLDGGGLVTRDVGLFYLEQRKDDSLLLRVFAALRDRLVGAFGGRVDHPRTRSAAIDWVFEQAPDLILFHRLTIKRRPESIAFGIYHDERLTERYASRYKLGPLISLWERRDRLTHGLVLPTGWDVVWRHHFDALGAEMARDRATDATTGGDAERGP